MALWLSRRQKERFLTEAKEFVFQMRTLDNARVNLTWKLSAKLKRD